MTMSPLSRTSTFSLAGMIRWLLNLATRMLACSLNMPEPLVHNTGVFVFAHVQAVETSVGRTLCPVRLLRQLRSLLQFRRRRPARWSRHPSTQPQKGELP
jgi:hypothetical protein